MKKTICVVLILALLFTLTACSSVGKEENPDIEPKLGTNVSDPSDARLEDAKETETEIQSTESTKESTEQEVTEMKMKIQVEDTAFTATLAENSSVEALKELIATAGGSLTLNMSDYANMEKGADLGTELPQNNEQMNTQAGDIILYQGRTFVIYYDTNSWSLTPIGKIDNVDAEALREALGDGDVTVTLSLE